MPCYTRMKRSFFQGLLWLYLYGFGFMALSLEPGFLDFDNLPDTNFSCVGKVIGGYYADLETNCQMFHVCTIGQLDEPMDIRFLCLNGTVFDQETRVCERIDEVDCTKSEQFYSLNLELYGHSQSSNLEEISETEQPLIIKSTPTTTTTTTPRPRKTTRSPYFTSISPPKITTTRTNTHHISTHHFPILNPSSSDIRFNPEEINISLHPGAPPDIRTKGPISYYSDKKVTNINSNSNSDNDLVVTTHRTVISHERVDNSGTSTQKSQVVHTFNQVTPNNLNGYAFTYRQDESGEYTEPPESYRIRTEFRPSQEYHGSYQNPISQRYKSSTYRSDYAPSTQTINNYQQKSSTTIKNLFFLKPPAPNQQIHYGEIRTEKSPQRIQLPLPLLPTLSPLTFSSPAPFSLQQRNEQKRYTKDHIPPPRIVISASASVSDASGRKLNYSLGTIGPAQLFKLPPNTYDEYKDEDVALDPFYLDVPKVRGSREKRSTSENRAKREEARKINYSDIIRNEEEALHVLKFLFDWYKNEKTNPARYTTPLSAPLDNEGISSINYGLAPETESSSIEDVDDDSLNFKIDTNDSYNKKSKYNVAGNDRASAYHEVETKINNVQEKYTIKHDNENEKDELFQHEEDYVNDNYEPLTYREPEPKDKENDNEEKQKHDYSNEYNTYRQNKKYSDQDDYIDDNIEPIYYKDRHFNKSTKNINKTNEAIIRSHQKEYHDQDYDNESNDFINKNREIKEGNFKDIYNINDHIHQVKEDYPEYDNDNKYSSQVDNNHSLHTEKPEELRSIKSNDITTPPPLEQSTERQKPVISRRGNRKFIDINKTDKEIDPKLIDKHIEKPHRAKDDYNFLRTIHDQTTSPKPSYQNTQTEETPITETEIIPTITENPTITTSLDPITVQTTIEVVTSIKEDKSPYTFNYTLTTAPVTSTEKPKNKLRRGKLKFRDYSNEETILRRKQPRIKSEADRTSKSLEYQEASNDYITISKQSTESSNENDSQEPYSEILESSTPNIKIENIADITSSHSTSESPPTTNPSITATPSHIDYIVKNKIPTATVANSYIGVYATSFVPTTETTHITKKKQLKENLLDTTFETTSTSVDTETTEETPLTTTWSPNKLMKLIHNIESNTKSVVAPQIHKKMNKETTTESESTTETSTVPIPTVDKTNTFNMSGMSLVSVSLEAKQNHEFESTTEDIPITTEVLELNESIGIQSLDFKKEMNEFISKLDSIKLKHKESLHSINSIEEDTTIKMEVISDTTDYTNPNLETTTELNKLPTTFEQTTLPPTTLDETSTEPTTLEQTTTVKPKRRGGKPNRRKSKSNLNAGYRHRFSTDNFTRRPAARKQTIEEEIVDVFRKGKDLTTESYRGNIGKKEYVLTDYPLRKSVNPTQSEKTSVTTPFSHTSPTKRHFFFNCFGKEIDRFYPDLRDCRLFHYCTQGYSKNQLLDMKFVCDFNTYFDDEKLICTKMKPKRC